MRMTINDSNWASMTQKDVQGVTFYTARVFINGALLQFSSTVRVKVLIAYERFIEML